jgi:hypothetical protein
MPFTPDRKDQMTCGSVCRQRYKRAKKDKGVKFAFVFTIEQVEILLKAVDLIDSEYSGTSREIPNIDELRRALNLTVQHNKENQKL